MMTKDIPAGKWKEVKSEIKKRWAKLTDDEVDQIKGQYEKLVGLLQERYGYLRQRAEQEVEQFFERFFEKSNP